MILPKFLESFFDEQKARYGELFWFEQDENKIVLMIEKLAQRTRELLEREGVEDITVTSFEADDSIGDFYLVEAEQIDVATRPSKQEYFSIMDKDLKGEFTDQTNDIYQNQQVRIFQPSGYESFCVVAYHSFGMQAPRGPIGWLKNLNGLKKVNGLEFQKPEQLKTLEQAVKELEGVKYQVGGGSVKNGFDCSALVQKIFYETKGIWLPRKSKWQTMVCRPVGLKDLQQGDLVFFHKRGDEDKIIEHVGLVYEIQTGKLPVVFHTRKSAGKALFEDLNQAEWLFSPSNQLGTRKISGFGRVNFKERKKSR